MTPSLQFITPFSTPIGVIGAGTMGSGIALTLLSAGFPVTLYELSPQILQHARGYIETHLARKNQSAHLNHLTLCSELEGLKGCVVLIEAIPEDLSLKQQIFSQLDRICQPSAILATNTSTLSVTAIAASTSHPGRVAGMHFFNPAPVLPLVEVVRGAQTDHTTVQSLITLAEKIGKTPVVASDTPGFIVNRVARPFYGEALRILGEGIATHEQIDQIIRLGAGFRMGPFQLMDLIGIDINLSAMQSMYAQTFNEPRYRPHPIQIQMVQQDLLGRKSGRGFYDYTGPTSLSEVQPPPIGRCSGFILIKDGGWAPGLGVLCRQAGYAVSNGASLRSVKPLLAIARAGRSQDLKKQLAELDRDLPPDVPVLCQCADVTITEAAGWVRHAEHLVGFDGLFFTQGQVASLVASPTSTRQIRSAVEYFVSSLGKLVIWLGESPGLVLPRIISMLANEAAFAVLDGVSEPEKIDKAMQLGLNYPRGPLSWAKEIGYTQITAILDHLRAEYGEERYRAAILLRRWARLEKVVS